jgi:regulator of sigma E protease
MISACLAVFNFLPLPIFDGGLVVLLIIEKIKGSPVHAKIQEGLVYIGLVLILGLFILVTYNDIVRWGIIKWILKWILNR